MERNGNSSLLRIAGRPSPYLSCLHRCPYKIVLMPWISRDRLVRMWREVHTGGCLGQGSRLHASRLPQTRRVMAPTCWMDPTLKEVCFLPGTWVRDIARKLPGLAQPSNYYPLVMIHIGSNEIAERSLRAVKRDFRALGQLLEGVGAQVVFSSSF